MVRLDDLFNHGSEDDFNPNKKKRVGGYVLGRPLGQGSFAKVRLGVHVLTKEKVALKVVDKKLVEKREYVRKNMRREAAVLQRLDHPNIIKLYEILETQNYFYIVTELAECGDMMKYINDRKGISESEARRYMRQLVSAVDHMHRAGVVHRDLKVENLLLNKDLSLKIIDFGLSNFFDGENMLSTHCGSPAYAAPEIFNKKQYGSTVDIWTIGVNLYAMVTGNLPFDVDPPRNLVKLHAMILRGCHIPASVSSGCQDLLRRLLEVDETKRINMADIMAHPWINDSYIPLEPWPLKRTMNPDHIDSKVISYMNEVLSYSEAAIRAALSSGRVSPLAATYHLLVQRLDKNLSLPVPQSGVHDTTAQIHMNEAMKNNNENSIDDTNQTGANISTIEPLLSLPTSNYRECLRQLKANRERSDLILKKPSVQAIKDPVDEVAEVNVSKEFRPHREYTRFSLQERTQNDREKLKTAPGSIKMEHTKLTPADIRFLSDKFLRHRVNDERFLPSSRPSTKEASTPDPSHRLRIMQLIHRSGPDLPPAPPNSAEARRRSRALPAVAPRGAATKDKERVHQCASNKNPVVHLSENPLPDNQTDRFYDKYRFKARNSDGERMLTWDLRALELPAMVGSSDRSKTLPDMKTRKLGNIYDRCKNKPANTMTSEADGVNLKNLGVSYTIPEHSTEIPKSRKYHTEVLSSLTTKRSYKILKPKGTQPKKPYSKTHNFLCSGDLNSDRIESIPVVEALNNG